MHPRNWFTFRAAGLRFVHADACLALEIFSKISPSHNPLARVGERLEIPGFGAQDFPADAPR